MESLAREVLLVSRMCILCLAMVDKKSKTLEWLSTRFERRFWMGCTNQVTGCRKQT
jgi:hypothetical protein